MRAAPHRPPTSAGTGALAALALLAACTPLFVDGAFQSLRLSFEIAEALPRGRATVVGTWAFPAAVTVKRRVVRLSGRLAPPPGAPQPDRVEVEARALDAETGKVRLRIRLPVSVRPDGGFVASTRIRRQLRAGSLLEVTVKPIGEDLVRRSTIELCVDLVERAADLAEVGDCAGEPLDLPDTLSEIQQQIFTPSCARAGCHDAASSQAGLVLSAGRSHGELVGVLATQSFLLRVAPNDPEGSYLLKKLRGDNDIVGGRMPLDGPPFLSDLELRGIVEWIDGGGADDRVAPSGRR